MKLACLLAATLAAQDYRVRAVALREGPIQHVLARVDAGRDVWEGERDYELLRTLFEDAAMRMKAGNRGVVPALAPTLARFATLQVAEFKIIAVGSGVASLRVELAGISTAGERISYITKATARFQKEKGAIRLGAFVPEPWRATQSARKWFVDVSERALAGNDSYRRQMVPPLDHWRRRMDGGGGLDVYGHNGVAVGDYDSDGWEDLFVAQPSGLPNRLYRNNGDGTFADVTRLAGLDVLDASSMGLFADVDNDSDQDLILITASAPVLFRNTGGRFARVSAAGFRSTTATLTGATLADYDRDGFIDLYVCTYGFWSPGAAYDAPTPYYDATNGPPNFLYRNRGDGTFEDRTVESGMNQNNNRFSFAAAWGDFNRDGWPDLLVANDFGRKNLYRNNGRGEKGAVTFTDVALELGVDDLGAGMSVAWGDFDDDGFPDVYTGNMWSSAGLRLTHHDQFARLAPDAGIRAAFQRQARGNSLFRNRQGQQFEDATIAAGVELGRWAWSSDFVDLDNDGWPDLYVQNGYVTADDPRDL